MNDLSLVPVEELIDELMSRAETGIVFIGLNDDKQTTWWEWTGNYYKALGMCDETKTLISESLRDDAENE